jgi:hypothetical protein
MFFSFALPLRQGGFPGPDGPGGLRRQKPAKKRVAMLCDLF